MTAPPGDRSTALTADALERILLQLCERIDRLLDEERAALAACTPEGIEAFVVRKDHLALEMTRLAHHAAGYAPGARVRARLVETRSRLASNAGDLSRHISALEEIMGLLAEIQARQSSDGTYSRLGGWGAVLA
jgi:hypothetical protein